MSEISSMADQVGGLANTIGGAVNGLGGITNAVGNESDAQKSANPAMSRYLALQCEAAELPGKTLQTADVKIYGPTFKVPYQTQYNEITLTFLCTNDFYERKLFDRWLEVINPTVSNDFRYPKGDSPENSYYSQINVIQYDDFVKQAYAVKLIDAFPINIQEQTVSWSDDNFHRLSVQFAFHRYEAITESTVDVGEAVTNLGLSAGRSLIRAF
mgnify:CR=1 FL=1